MRTEFLLVAVWMCLSVAIPEATAGSVSVPFVGCDSDGQAGPVEAPVGKSRDVSLSADIARRLAYYKAEVGSGVLAPRGWHCLGIYGSGGAGLFVTQSPIDPRSIFSASWKGFTGPAIYIDGTDGESGSGRTWVADVIAHVFSAHRQFAEEVMDAFDIPKSPFRFSPYPADRLTYKSPEIVEYQTPAGKTGLGTHFGLLKGKGPIRGVAMLFGEPPSLVLLSVRLPPGLRSLSSAIIQETERDAASGNSVH